MKFGKTYTEYIERQVQNRLAGCSYVKFKRFKKVLKRCPLQHSHHRPTHGPIPSFTLLGVDHSSPNRPHHDHTSEPASPTSNEVSLSCPGCDAMFFGELMLELEEVVGCFNTRAQELLQLHLASGFRKFFLYLTSSNLDRAAMIQRGRSLVSYAFLNATAVRKILKKYDKVCKNQFGLWTIFPYTQAVSSPVIEGLGEFSCDFESDSPTLSCTVLESARLEFVLNCSICLDTVFDPVALGCGHVFCNSCVCAAASVPAYEGPRAADSSVKCPLCRKGGVYLNAVRLKELATLVHYRCKAYWTERLQKERKEQLREAKMASERILREVMRA